MTSDEGAGPGDGTRGPLPFDVSKAHQARVYDYLLGGKDNYAADRTWAEAALAAWPGSAFTARANRAFLGRMVRYLADEAGVRQFLDIGTGIPTAGNVHEVSQAVAPESRVVYVDYDPVVLAHARALLDSHEAGATTYLNADLRDTGTILGQASTLLDFTKPVAITLLAILHAVSDADDPYAIVARLLDAVPPGSYLAVSHMGSDLFGPEVSERLQSLNGSGSQQQYFHRTGEEVARFFGGTDLVPPGLVRVEEWRSEPAADDARTSGMWAAVGRKRA
jgi:hypothetical protein